MRPIPTFSVLILALGLAACGGDEPASDESAGQSVAASSPAAKSTARVSQADSPQGHCALIQPAEIEALFPMALKLGAPKVVGRADNPLHGCEVQLGIGEVGQLTFGTTSEGTYNEYARYLEQSSTPSRMIEGLGEEAFLLNNAQLLVRRADGQFLNISVMLITMGGPPLSQEEMAESVVGLGRLLDERL
jgi:hypothetical protein